VENPSIEEFPMSSKRIAFDVSFKLQVVKMIKDQGLSVSQVCLWDEIAKTSPRCARVVNIFKQYNSLMAKASAPYR
jgi:hypothetical protein